MRTARLFLCAILLAATIANAQQWPSKPVRFVVPFAPGGTTDILARIVGQQLAEGLGQPFVIENRAGAGGNIGAAEVAKAAPDGYTILMGTPGTQAINQFIYNKMPYNTEKDFAPVSLVARVPNVLVVHPGVGVKSLPRSHPIRARESQQAELGFARRRHHRASFARALQDADGRADPACALQGERAGAERPHRRPGTDDHRQSTLGDAAYPGREADCAGRHHRAEGVRAARCAHGREHGPWL